MTRSPADRTAWQRAFSLGEEAGETGVETPILGEQVSVGGRRLYRWIGRW